MFITYHEDDTWQLADKLEEDTFFVADIKGPITPADDSITAQLLSRCYRPSNFDKTNCILWGAGSYGGTGRSRNPIPYLLPRHPLLRYAEPARQLLIASHLNIHWSIMPKFRVSMRCTTPRCMNVHHIMPETFRPRLNKKPLRDSDMIPLPTVVEDARQAEYNRYAEEIRERIDGTGPKKHRRSDINDIMKLLDQADTNDKKSSS